MARPAPNALAGATIRRFREDRGWSQPRLVQELCATATALGHHTPGVTVQMISKWENDKVGLSAFYAELVDATFARTMDVDPEPGRYDMDRRRFLTGASTVGAVAYASTFGLEPWQRLSSSLQRRTRVDLTVVDNLETMTTTLSRLFLTVAPVALVGPSRSHLDTLTQLLNDGSIPARLRRRLASLAGESSILMAWLMQDQGDDAIAQEFYLTALDAADEAGDPGIGAYAIASASTLEAFRSSPSQSIHLLTDATVKGSAVRAATPSTRAWAYSLVAEAYTRDGNTAEAFRALDIAQDILSSEHDDDPRPRSPFFDSARLAGERGVTGVRLHRPDDAEPALLEALAGLEKDPKSESRILTHLARVQLQRSEVEQACATVMRSLEVARRTGSSTGVRDIHDFRRGLTRWKDIDAVRQLDDHLAVKIA